MFRVNQTEWINPKAVGIYHIEIAETNNCGDKVYYVSIETEEANYDSDIFPTFEDAETFVLELVGKLN